MTTINSEIEINASIDRVFEYYTNPDNIKESWPRDIVKESENVSDQKSKEDSEMKVTGEYMGKRDEMLLEVVEKEQNKRLVPRQTVSFPKMGKHAKVPKQWNNSTWITRAINYELPNTGKIANFISGSQGEDKIRQGIIQAAPSVKQNLESC